MVTNIERSLLSSSLRDVLAKRFSSVDADEQMINITSQPVSVHVDFRLILSSSVPLTVRGIYISRLLLRCKELRERLGIDDMTLVLQQNRLRWYGHVLRKEDDDLVKKRMEYEV